MRCILALTALLPVPTFATQEEAGAPPVITVAGQSFPTWQAYLDSPLFQSLGLRCGTRVGGSTQELRPPSDCSLSSTTIRPEYEPAGNVLYRIPVVVHVLIATNGQGQISDALIHSQIDVLNEDFLALAGTLGENGNDARIEFFLATVDPSGNPTTGITRTVNDSWFNDTGNYYDLLRWDPDNYLNIYTNSASGALGYVPDLPQGGIVGANSDRVVVLWSAFGRNAPIGPPYDLGRTATHELGHYFGLYHTFDGGCGSASACFTTGDRICDTNPESGPVFGCPTSHSSCGSPDPFHNYMDYSDDDCYEEFTPQQVNRMRCTLENWRADLHEPAPCLAPASVATRTGGTNVNGYTATPPVLGSNFTLSVVAPGRTTAVVIGHAAPASKPLPRGMLLLIDNLSPLYFTRTLALPPGTAVLTMPNDVALCGVTAYTQAILIGGGLWGITNAVDLTPGT
jgi:hypothetical protein